jgi:hypothetical protein
MNPAERMCGLRGPTVSKLAARGLTCIKSYPLNDAMVTRLIKSMAGD